MTAAPRMPRRREPERMDDPRLDAAAHRAALAGLARLNALSRSAATIWGAIRPLARRGGRPLRLLDVACGGGDVPLRVQQLARRAGCTVHIAGCDVSATALDVARRRAERCGAPLELLAINVLREPLPGPFDVVTSSLFLHHLDEADALTLLDRMRGVAGQMLLIDDLRRSRAGLALAWLAGRTLTRCPVVRTDAVRSARAAFTIPEIAHLARDAGLHGAIVTPRWPSRLLLQWTRA